ncbi:unnamed protein product [Chironomus riparius]|uniref:RRM domain-containing protein n=1 Tax=Chironomus riparius TaxID=315576 RepID=A0A9N9RUS1_9DIPT|nr:unnamed protein product [Chironomus riparius]
MISQKDNEEGKLFVGGLSWDTQADSLQRYFSRYGEVIDCVVMKNNETGRSRGFGFVTFADPENVKRALENCPHNLDGRTIDPKPCNPRSMHKPKRANAGFPKVFLGGLPANVTESDLRAFFVRYGQVMEVVIMYDQEKKKSRGFGFLSFDSDASVDRACADHFINLNGKQVEIKKAEPRDGSTNHMMQMDPNQSIGASHWGGPIIGNGGPMPMGPISVPNMGNMGNTGFNYNYGSTTPSNPSFGWPTPQQWGNNNYAVPPHQAQQGAAQGAYGAYEYNGAIGYNSTSSYGANGNNWNSWNPNITNIAPNTGSTSGEHMYRPQSGPNMHSAPPPNGGGNLSKPGSEYNGAAAYNGAYTNYYSEQPFSNQNRPRSYGNNEQYPAF